MEEEYIRYRNASMKQRLIIARRFYKFYLNEYIPMTKLEADDLKRSRYTYHTFTVAGALLFGFVSFRVRRAKMGSLETAGVSKDNNLPLYILNDAMAGFFGFCCGQFLSADYTYKNRQYVIERQSMERMRGYTLRQSRPANAEFLDEYPLKDLVSRSDE